MHRVLIMLSFYYILGFKKCAAGCLYADDVEPPLSEFVNPGQGNGSFYLPPEIFNNFTNSSAANSSEPAGNLTETENIAKLDLTRRISENESLDTTTESFNTKSHEEQDEDMVKDLTVTDSSGCFTAKRDQLEENCHVKLSNVIYHLDTEDEAIRRKEVCCAVEDYEKCSLNGYKTTNCDVDQKVLKETLRSARIFMGVMTNISCSEHRGVCASASATYASGLLMASVLVVLLL